MSVAKAPELLGVAHSRAGELAGQPPAAARLTKSLMRAEAGTLLARLEMEAQLFAGRVAADETRAALMLFPNVGRRISVAFSTGSRRTQLVLRGNL